MRASRHFFNMLSIPSSNQRLNVNWLKLTRARPVSNFCWLILINLGHFFTRVYLCWLVLTRFRLVVIRVDSCHTRIDSCQTRVDSCWFVLDLRWRVLIRVYLCWYSCIRIDLIKVMSIEHKNGEKILDFHDSVFTEK